MESDLGIDTVKQAEMFGMIRDSFNISKDESIKIKDFPTLDHVVDFVKSRSPEYKGVDFSAAPAPQPAAAQAAPPQPVMQPAAQTLDGGPLGDIKKKILAIVGEKTGYSEDLIEFDLDMESDLGIDTVKQAEMFGMIRDSFNIPKDESIKIKDFPTLNHVIGFVRDKSPHKFEEVPAQPVPAAPQTAVAQAAPVQAAVTAAAPAGDGLYSFQFFC